MLRDITIGQHFPGNSPVHLLDARLKILLTTVFIVALFMGSNPFGMAASVVFLAVLYYFASIPIKVIAKSLKPIIPLLLFTSILNLFFIAGRPIFSYYFITVTYEGLYFSILMTVRIICLISGTSLLTYTTSPIVLTDALERLMAPLKAVKLPVHELSMMMTIALRFIPTLIEETEKIMNAQKARGSSLDTGGLKERITAMVPVLIPLFVSAFRRADELATAMECRCYTGGEGRTRLKQLKMLASDYIYGAFCLAFFTLIAFGNYFFKFYSI